MAAWQVLIRRTHSLRADLHARAKARHAARHPTTAPANAQMHESLSLVDHAALLITDGVGTMWCALLFTALACISLPAAIATHDPIIIVAWIAQTFLQLVLLSVILLGQNLQNRHAELRAEADHALNQETAAQMTALVERLDALLPPPELPQRGTPKAPPS